VVHPLDVGALTVTLRAVSAPISLTVPVAVRHWPTSNAAEVAGTVSLIWVDLFSSNLMLVRAGGLADLELVARLLAEIRRPWSSIASADLAVTAPKALEKLRGREELPGPPRGAPEPPPPVGKVRPPDPGSLVVPVQVVADFEVVASTETSVAARVDLPLAVPVALTQAPTATSAAVRPLVRRILVAEVIRTDVWPEVVCASSVDPSTAAILPEANERDGCVVGAAAAPAVPGRPSATAPRTTSATHALFPNAVLDTSHHPRAVTCAQPESSL